MLVRQSARETFVVRGANYASRAPYVFLKARQNAIPKGWKARRFSNNCTIIQLLRRIELCTADKKFGQKNPSIEIVTNKYRNTNIAWNIVKEVAYSECND